MAITLTTTSQLIGTANDAGFRAQLFGWYSNKSGNNATVHIELKVTFIDSSYTVYTGSNKSFSLNFNGTSSGQYANYMYLNSAISMAERTKSMTGGSTINASGAWYSYNYGNISVGLSDTVRLPVFVVAPTKPSLTITNNNAHQNTISYGTSSFGNPASGTVKLYVANNAAMTSKTLLETKTTTGLTNFVHTGLTADTTYYYQVIADNTSATSESTGNVTTRKAVYVPNASNKTTLVQNLLVPHNGLTKNVVKLYRGDSNNEAERIY